MARLTVSVHAIDYSLNLRHTKQNDLALLHIAPDPNMEDRLKDHPARPIKLIPPEFDPRGEDCIVSGWGREWANGAVPDEMRETDVLVLRDPVCTVREFK